MGPDWKTRTSLGLHKYFTAPVIAALVFVVDRIFILADYLAGRKAEPLSDEQALDEYRRALDLKPEHVPENLRDLLPLAIKWGIGDDAIRGYVTDAASEKDRDELVAALKGRLHAIDQWLDGFAEGALSDEAAAFLYLGEAVDEMQLEIRYE
jgi:hypothetical protein